ncbi:LPS-assembly protein LptD [Elioraea rosea]|uniref:LPS-assembly protein LptD n=1 Tax=Elioraea rosea TaxID=2492390 RepID=UPI0011833F1C|nr:LPS assembly protein LptD [Elioraea rosea]
MRRHIRRGALLASTALMLAAGAAAQQAGRETRPEAREPVAFTAGELSFDERSNTVIASGGVEAWQGGRVLRAREIRFNRNTNRILARGDVAIVEEDGRVLFAEEAELTDDMREGVARDIRALLAEGGRFAANGARRSEGRFTDMRRGVYSTCESCPENPQRPPLWQIRADRVIHDEQEKTVEYFDATLQFAGVPVAYVPYFSHPDPSVKRQSGFLFPDFGSSKHLGAFFRQPYYWAISPQSDATFAPMITSRQNVPVFGEYRRRFNSGFFTVRGSGTIDSDREGRGHIFSTGRFSIDETWRAGWNLQRSSDRDYLRQYRVGNLDSSSALVTEPFVEGFGRNFYMRADSFWYQGLRVDDSRDEIPLVLPRGYAEYVTDIDRLGGQLNTSVGFFATNRRTGTDTRRVASRATYSVPISGPIGDVWTFAGNLDVIGYNVGGDTTATPVPGGRDGTYGRAHPQVSATWRWPLIRAGWGGAQLIEPIVQAVAGPSIGDTTRYPNEDSVDLEFSASNLFGFNKYPGVDRLEGGTRINAGLRGAWYVGGMSIDGLFGQSYRLTDDSSFPAGSGLESRRSDYVTRLSVSPNEYVTLSYRGRFDNDNFSNALSDFNGTFSYGGRYLSLSYIDAPAQPLALQPEARREIVAAVGGKIHGFWRGAVGARRDLEANEMVASFGSLTYEDECFAFQAIYSRRFSSTQTQDQGTDLIFRLVFKTVGDFGFSAF